MTYAEFKKVVAEKGWTVPVLRSDSAPPTRELLDLMDELGLKKYEQFVMRYEREQGAK
jgi:hypothetical protein